MTWSRPLEVGPQATQVQLLISTIHVSILTDCL
jgi:hypothetical protein